MNGLDDINHELINDIALFRDLSNDIDENGFQRELEILEKKAFDLLAHNMDIKRGAAKINAAVIGNFNGGKSSFINSFLGRLVCPVRANPTTSSITRFIYSDEEKIILKNTGETITHDEYLQICKHETGKTESTQTYVIDYFYPFEGFRNIILQDTPGFKNGKNKLDQQVSIDTAKKADVIFLLMDINNGDLDADLLEVIDGIHNKNSRCEWYLIANHADDKSPDERSNIIAHLKKKYKARFRDILPYSAKEIIDRPEDQYSDILKNIRNKIESGLNENLPKIELQISAEKCPSRRSKKIIFHVGDMKINLQEPSPFLTQRSQIINVLKDIGEKKDKILLGNFNEKFLNYRIFRGNSLMSVSEKIHADLKISEALNDDNIISYCEKLKKDIKEIFLSRYQCLCNWPESLLDIIKLNACTEASEKLDEVYDTFVRYERWFEQFENWKRRSKNFKDEKIKSQIDIFCDWINRLNILVQKLFTEIDMGLNTEGEDFYNEIKNELIYLGKELEFNFQANNLYPKDARDKQYDEWENRLRYFIRESSSWVKEFFPWTESAIFFMGLSKLLTVQEVDNSIKSYWLTPYAEVSLDYSYCKKWISHNLTPVLSEAEALIHSINKELKNSFNNTVSLDISKFENSCKNLLSGKIQKLFETTLKGKYFDDEDDQNMKEELEVLKTSIIKFYLEISSLEHFFEVYEKDIFEVLFKYVQKQMEQKKQMQLVQNKIMGFLEKNSNIVILKN